MADRTSVVRAGYDAVSRAYRSDDGDVHAYDDWLGRLHLDALGRPADVVDLGCGCGIPAASALADLGHSVHGVDLSPVQVERARALVPAATFEVADLRSVDLPAASVDAVVCAYAIIHVPVADQAEVFLRIGRWLRPGGRLLAVVGEHPWEGTEEGWLGATMWWSQAGAATYRDWVRAAGLRIEHDQHVPEGASGHRVVVAVR